MAVKRPAFHVVGIAASAGGIRALTQLVTALPQDFPAAIAIVQHLDPHAHSLLPQILGHHTPLRVKHPIVGESIQAGTIYVALPDWHLVVSHAGTFDLTQTQRVNFARPSADCLFHTLATHYGPRAIAVVLTGKGQDGATGLKAIGQRGGITIAQAPSTAEWPGMPSAAIQTQAVKFVLPLNQIAKTLVQLVERQSE